MCMMCFNLSVHVIQMTSPLVNCIVSYAAVNATLSEQSEVRAAQWSRIWSSGRGVAKSKNRTGGTVLYVHARHC